MNAMVLPPTFLAAALAILLAITTLGISRRARSRVDGWLFPALTILAVVSLGAFFIYTFSAAGSLAAGLK